MQGSETAGTEASGTAVTADNVRSLTLLNLSGDSTLTWGPDLDERMVEVIQRKIDEGIVFHVLHRRFGGLLPILPRKERITDARQALASRSLSMDDADFAGLVCEGGFQLVKTPAVPGGLLAGGSSKTTDPAVIASNQCVGVRPLSGG